MGQKVFIGALALVFLATACGPIKKKKNENHEEVVIAGFNSTFSGAIYFDNKESYQRLDMRSGTSENFLASGQKMTSASISGDRFVTVKRSKSYPEVLIVGRNKEPLTRIALPENPDGTPKLSRDGQFILIGRIAGDTYIYNLSGQMMVNLRTNISSYDWLPDGRILFSRFGTLYEMDANFKAYRVYKAFPGTLHSLSISPDGTKVALEMGATDPHIWIFDLGQSTLRQVTTSKSAEHYPSWSPDGNHLVLAKGKVLPPSLIDNGDSKPKVQGCLELWVVNAHADKVSDLNSEDQANTFRVKQNVAGQIAETCATSAPSWRAE